MAKKYRRFIRRTGRKINTRRYIKKRTRIFKKRVYRAIKAIAEKKIVNEGTAATYTVATGSTMTVVPVLTGTISQGVTKSTRVAQMVATKNITLSIQFTVTAGNPAVIDSQLRMIIVKPRVSRPLVTGDFPATLINSNNPEAYQTIKDMTFKLGNPITGNSVSNRIFNMKIPLRFNWKWEGAGTVQGDETKTLWMGFMFVPDQIGGAVISQTYVVGTTCRVSFIDV